MTDSDQTLKARLNKETSKIAWQELQRFYARGVVIGVMPDMDLLEVACQFAQDNKTMVEPWLEQGKVFKVNDQQASSWLEDNTVHWAVVVAPWVLVQEFHQTQ